MHRLQHLIPLPLVLHPALIYKINTKPVHDLYSLNAHAPRINQITILSTNCMIESERAGFEPTYLRGLELFQSP
jgi:hypothetical protein